MIRRHHPDGRAGTGHEAVEIGDRARCDPPAVRRDSIKLAKKKSEKKFSLKKNSTTKKDTVSALKL